jgi:hypothetical protein
VYTKSLIFQNPENKENLEDVRPESSDLLEYLGSVHLDTSTPVPEQFKALQKSLVDARVLAAELGCQRGACYELDEDIKVGDPYDDERMTTATQTGEVDERDSQAVVSCVIAKGWIKRPYAGSKEIKARICKARVLVKVQHLVL